MRAAMRLHLRVALFAASALAGSAALAETRYLPPIPVDDGSVRDYRCEDGKSLQVAYFNQHDGQGFAVLTVEGRRLLFVDTVAASGVRYVACRYVWWTKGDHGDLYDAMAGANAHPLVGGCVATAKQR